MIDFYDDRLIEKPTVRLYGSSLNAPPPKITCHFDALESSVPLEQVQSSPKIISDAFMVKVLRQDLKDQDAIIKKLQSDLLIQGIPALLKKREATHGDFRHTAELAQKLKEALREVLGAQAVFTPVILETTDMICTKLARIACGDEQEPDHWQDIAGYATLVVDFITQNQQKKEV